MKKARKQEIKRAASKESKRARQQENKKAKRAKKEETRIAGNLKFYRNRDTAGSRLQIRYLQIETFSQYSLNLGERPL